MTTIPPTSSPCAQPVSQIVGPGRPVSSVISGKRRRDRSEPVRILRNVQCNRGLFWESATA